jgi:hypothetical protein
VYFGELRNNCLCGLCFHDGDELADARGRFETNAEETWNFQERVDFFGEFLFDCCLIFVLFQELFEHIASALEILGALSFKKALKHL